MGEDWAGGRGRQALALVTACAACICGLIATRQLAVCAPPCLVQRFCIWLSSRFLAGANTNVVILLIVCF
jgi:hypothetical protein